MKKLLSLLGLICILAMSGGAANAAPPPQGMHGMHGVHGGGIHVSATPRGHHMTPPPMRKHGGSAVIGGVLVRRGCWSYTDCYFDRLGFCDDYYYRPAHYHNGVYVNLGFPIRF